MTTNTPGAAPQVVALIPARGGSKGVPGKNLKKVGGIPLVARAVASALAAETIDAVYVSTDDRAIAAAARAAGAEVIDRPADLASDSASSEAALLHVLDALPFEPHVLVFLQATSPFIEPGDLDDAVDRVRAGESDSLFSARKTHAFLWRITQTGAEGVNHDASVRLRRQDLEPQFQETGAFYVMRAAGFRAARFRFFGRVGVAVVDDLTAVDIDSADDLELATRIAPMLTPRGTIDVDAVVTDFDGVHTDDRVLVGEDGSEYVFANRSDGMGVRLLREAGVPVLILSTEVNPVVAARARKLGVPVLHGVDDKAGALRAWASDAGIALDRIAYLGNDVNDLAALDLVGWPIATADAHPLVRSAARVVLTRRGGDAAVRELAELAMPTAKETP